VKLPPPIPGTEAVPLTLGQLGALVRCLVTVRRPIVRIDPMTPRKERQRTKKPRTFARRFRCRGACGREQTRGTSSKQCFFCGGRLTYLGRVSGRMLM
jgi:hypothetical protein